MHVDLDDFAALQQARELWTAGKIEAAMRGFERAVRGRPRNVRALVEFARALGQQYQIEQAEELLGRASELAGDSQTALPSIARTFRSIYRPARAIDLFERLSRQDRLASPLLGELAILYEQAGRFDDALEVITRCIVNAPQRHEPKLIQARILRIQGAFGPAERTLLKLTRVADAPPILHVRAWAEICQIWDRQGDFAGAVDAIERAKSILRDSPQAQTMARQAVALNELFAKLYDSLDDATMSSWAQSTSPRHDEVGGVAHLLGFPRSGTTLLEQVLDAHPRILSAPERVVFTKDIFPAICRSHGRHVISWDALASTSSEVLTRERARYLRYHEAIHGETLRGRIHLDKNPNHTSLAAGLYRLFPESRFLCALRDPRDVVVSAYLRYFPLSEFSANFLNWESTCRLYVHEMTICLRMRRAIPDAWLEVRYEDTVVDPPTQARRVCDFLGIAWDDALMHYRDLTQHKVINSPSHADVRQPLYGRAVGRWRNYHKFLAPYLKHLEPFIQAFGYHVDL